MKLSSHPGAIRAAALALLCFAPIALPSAALGSTSASSSKHLPYMWQIDVPGDVTVTNLRISDIYLPDKVKVEWAPIQLYYGPAIIEVQRGVSGTFTTIGSSNTGSYLDTYAYPTGVQWQYKAHVTPGQDINA